MPLLLDLKVFVQLTTRQYLSFAPGGGVLDLSLGRGGAAQNLTP